MKRGVGMENREKSLHVDVAVERQEAELSGVLQDFRASAHAWSDAAFHERPMTFHSLPRHAVARRTLAWVMSLTIAVGVAGGGGYEWHHRQELARQAALREAEHQRMLQQQHAQDVDELLARIDSDVSRQVPSALEPLASLMGDDQAQ